MTSCGCPPQSSKVIPPLVRRSSPETDDVSSPTGKHPQLNLPISCQVYSAAQIPHPIAGVAREEPKDQALGVPCCSRLLPASNPMTARMHEVGRAGSCDPEPPLIHWWGCEEPNRCQPTGVITPHRRAVIKRLRYGVDTRITSRP